MRNYYERICNSIRKFKYTYAAVCEIAMKVYAATYRKTDMLSRHYTVLAQTYMRQQIRGDSWNVYTEIHDEIR